MLKLAIDELLKRRLEISPEPSCYASQTPILPQEYVHAASKIHKIYPTLP